MEATKAVQIIKPTTSTPSRNILKKNSTSNQSGNPRKKQKITEKPKQLVSNRRFEPKVKKKKKKVFLNQLLEYLILISYVDQY